MLDARVSQTVQQIHEEIHQNECRRYEQDTALDHRVISREDRIDQKPTHSGPCKDSFSNYGSGHSVAELQPNHCYYGKQCIAKYMD